MKLENIIEELTIDDMPTDDMRFLAEHCGINVVVNLILNVSGCTFFIPKEGFKKFYARKILTEYDNTTLSLKRLAIKYDTTEGNIREILKAANIALPSEGQIGIFEGQV